MRITQPDWKALLIWFDMAQRDLPWRGTKDPYAILVSELMLQQTQVQTVLPFYMRFMERFPDLQSLAIAQEEEVLSYWSGLGYYRRGVNLHRAAREIIADHQGVIPADKAKLLSLPGIGEYTAGAILSIAFNQRVPLVDGNVGRVLSRLFAMDKDLSTSEGKEAIWQLAKEAVPLARPGCHNQALMELGATVCLPTQPRCHKCPLETMCRAHLMGKTMELPVKSRRIRREKIHEAVLLVDSQGQWLLTNQNEEGLYVGLWQFPWTWRKNAANGNHRPPSFSTWQSAFLPLTGVLGHSLENAQEVGTTRHVVTFRSIQTTFFWIRLPSPCGLPANHFRWAATESLSRMALPAYQKKALNFVPRLLAD